MRQSSISTNQSTNTSPKGVYKVGGKWRVIRYEMHIGMYDTYEEAVEASNKADDEQEVFEMMQKYLEAKEYLKKRGIIFQ
jgi:hypothetical protein